MTQSALFWDRVAERYSKKPVADEAAYQRKLEITRTFLEPGMQVLEIGCGTGSTAIRHAPYVGRIRATDISPAMIEIAKRRAADANIDNVQFDVAPVDGLDVADGSQDAVLALSLLHLVEDRDKVITSVRRMLKPGGVLVTSTPCMGDTMKWFKLVGPIGRALGIWPLVRVFRVQELVDSLTNAGLRIEQQWQPGTGKAVFIVARKA